MAQNGIIPKAGEADSTADAIGRPDRPLRQRTLPEQSKYRPVDRRQNFVKRVVRTPRTASENRQRHHLHRRSKTTRTRRSTVSNYVIATRRALADDDLHRLGIARADLQERRRRRRIIHHPHICPGLHYYWHTRHYSHTRRPARRRHNDSRRTLQCHDRHRPVPAGIADSWTLSDYGGNNGLLIPAARGLTVPSLPKTGKSTDASYATTKTTPTPAGSTGKAW